MNDITLSPDSIRLKIKQEISADKELHESLARLDSYKGLVSALLEWFSVKFEGYSIHAIISEIAAEIIKLRADPGHYLVDNDGRTILKITNDMLYKSPPAMGEDGIEREGQLKLHPKISAGIAMAYHETSRLRTLEKQYPDHIALVHLKSPESIGVRALALIQERLLVEIGIDESAEFTEEILKFGQENIDGVYQSFNPAFIRMEAFAMQLFKHIERKPIKKVQILSIDRKHNYKSSWYEAHLLYQ